MILKYTELSENSGFSRYYHISNDADEDIGMVEGHGNENGNFVSVVKIYNPKYQRIGLGFDAFKKIFDEINSIVPISVIVGSWHKGGEFQDFEDGMSTNLKVFFESFNTENEEKSAFLTPTGKWAQKLGFNNCKVSSIAHDEVSVFFFK